MIWIIIIVIALIILKHSKNNGGTGFSSIIDNLRGIFGGIIDLSDGYDRGSLIKDRNYKYYGNISTYNLQETYLDTYTDWIYFTALDKYTLKVTALTYNNNKIDVKMDVSRSQSFLISDSIPDILFTTIRPRERR